jgi:hypothetical protein
MGIDACIEELKKALDSLFDTSIEKQRKRIPKTERFQSLEYYMVFGRIVNPRTENGKRDMVDNRPDLCRT